MLCSLVFSILLIVKLVLLLVGVGGVTSLQVTVVLANLTGLALSISFFVRLYCFYKQSKNMGWALPLWFVILYIPNLGVLYRGTRVQRDEFVLTVAYSHQSTEVENFLRYLDFLKVREVKEIE